MTKRWEKVKVADLKEGDVVKVCGIVADEWAASAGATEVYFYRLDERRLRKAFAHISQDAIVKRKVIEPKPKRYIVEVRPPKKGERFFIDNRIEEAANDWRDFYVVIVEELP